MAIIVSPFQIFADTTGKPLENGKIYVGSINQNPETNPVQVYWDSALTIPAAQPIRTRGGYPWRSGTPAKIYVGDSYSITIRDKNGVFIFTSPNELASSSDQFDLVVDSNAKLDSWCQNTTGTFKRVLIRTGTWTASALGVTPGIWLNLDTSGTTYIFAEPGSNLVLSAAYVGKMIGMYRVARKTDLNGERFVGPKITVTNSQSTQNATGFYNLTNLVDARADVIAGTVSGVARAFENCRATTFPSGTVSAFGASAMIYQTLVNADSPYTAIAFMDEVLNINATTNPFIVNLPKATDAATWRLEIINSSILVTGLVQIVPFAGDKIGPMAANVAAYLSNWNQSGAFKTKQTLKLVSLGDTTVGIAGGQFNPEPGSVDAAGSQYFFGKLHHLPTGNNNSRQVYSAAPPASTTFSAAINVAGFVGVPAGATGVRVKVFHSVFATAAGQCQARLDLSDNNTIVPGYSWPGPSLWKRFQAAAAGDVVTDMFEMDVPLSPTGTMYLYSEAPTNATLASGSVAVIAVGYYMGD